MIKKLKKKIALLFNPGKRKRLETYKKLLNHWENNNEFIYPGICISFNFLNIKESIQQLPELRIQEPKDHIIYGSYWWERYSKQPRVEAIKNAIKLITE